VHPPIIDVRELPAESTTSLVVVAELSAGPLATDDPAERAQLAP